MKDNRREFIKKGTAFAALSAVGAGSITAGILDSDDKKTVDFSKFPTQKKVEWPMIVGPNMPRMCMPVSSRAAVEEMRQTKQLGVDYVQMGGGQIPWKEGELRTIIDNFKTEGLTVINMMIGGMTNIIQGKEGRDGDIEKIKESIISAGKAGIPVVEYNFYVARLMDGYYELKGRGGAGMTAFKALETDLPPRVNAGPFTADQLWANLTYFLKAVVPVAEKAGVRLAVHPNDPPVPVSHGSAQIIASFRDWKRLIDIVDSPSNGMTYDCGVSREMGEDPVEVLRYLGSKDRVNHIHYRNVTVEEPYKKYAEVFYDEGQVNMFAVMQEIFRQGYKRGLNPEHPRLLAYDLEHPRGITTWKQYPGGGGYAGEGYDMGYTRAMMQAVLSLP
jgi:mannonate dehydratase